MSDERDIIHRLEAEAIGHDHWDWHELGRKPVPRPLLHKDSAKLAREAAAEILRLRAALAGERERCARVADERAKVLWRLLHGEAEHPANTAEQIAASIRALPVEGE